MQSGLSDCELGHFIMHSQSAFFEHVNYIHPSAEISATTTIRLRQIRETKNSFKRVTGLAEMNPRIK